MASVQAKLRVGILSTAAIATKNVSAARASGAVEVVAVASRDIARARAWAAAHDVPVAYGSYEELLADASVEAVYVPLPTGARKEWVVKAAAAGKHILCEKPCAVTLADLQEMAGACAAAGKVFMDGVMFMHDTRLEYMMRAISDMATLGAPRRVTSAFSFCGDDAFVAGNIRMSAALEPAGCLGDLGWYCIRASLWAFGYEPPAHAAAVFHAATPQGVPLEATATLTWPDGRVATFDCSFRTALRQWLEVAGTAGFVSLDDFVIPREGPSRFTVTRNPRLSEGHRVAVADSATVDVAPAGGLRQEEAMWARFAGLARGGGAAAEGAGFWAAVALQTQAVLDACMESGLKAGGLPVPVKPL